jgi:hypothetical protein
VSDDHEIRFAAKIDTEGRFIPREATTRLKLQRWQKYGEIEVTVRRDRVPKTDDQMGYYRGVVLPLFAEHIGDDRESTHVDLKRECFPRRLRVSKLSGEEFEDIPSLADATKEEMTEFLDRVIRLATSIRLPIPPSHNSPEYAAWKGGL